MVPDLATIRDRAQNKWRKRIYGALSLGWRGTAQNWNHYEMVYMLLAGLSTPLVLSVHSIVSFDFAVANLANQAKYSLSPANVDTGTSIVTAENIDTVQACIDAGRC